MVLRRTLTVGTLILAFAVISRADTLSPKDIAQQIRQGSVLQLRQNVAGFWASNLLAAQDPSVCSYCASEPDSLSLSIAAVLRAITIEADPVYGFGLTFCNLANCIIANAQSTIAIDDQVSVTLTPASIDFGEVPIATPEPSTLAMLACAGFSLITLDLQRRKPRKFFL